MFDVRRLRVLDEVVRCGSLSAAATSLSYTTSAISQQVSALERELGVPLLVRGPMGARPTPAGTELLAHAGAILTAVSAAERAVAAFAPGGSSGVRVASFASAAAMILPRALMRFRTAFPGVPVELITADPDDGVALLGDGKADLALITEVPGERPLYPEVVAMPVYEDEFYVVLPQRHRFAGAADVPLTALAREQWIISSATGRCPDTRVFRGACRRAGFVPTVAFRSEDYATVQGMVGAGMGVSLVPSLAVSATREDVAIRRVAGRRPARRIALATATTPAPGSPLAAFAGLIRTEGTRLRDQERLQHC
ncbi:LysR family transcriptional regulator [Nocardia macrotermitis]|uniref:HTH-type transcriptional regulator GltC n=1 Tax=Nocardia macrotermitis TaxID=2585198 RepID=A0A7K0D8A5_9NOCA|nr:LysR family transcriptional regulator [Nocardia macrotermitis]MQY21781.1 HTH-type transcriptional regulator GltC [Nocardia macrotermitis]